MTRKEARDRRIGELLAAGKSQRQVREELGLSVNVVSRAALRLGFRCGAGPPRRYDWDAIRVYYETGHTVRECRDHFGFSPGAWDQAVIRGDITPRPVPDPKKHSHTTRKAVARLLADGKRQSEIAAALGLAKATVAFHVRALGVPPDSRFSRRYDWIAVQAAYDRGLSLNDCAERFGFSKSSWCQAVERGDIIPRPREMPLERLLIRGPKRGRENIKRRLLAAGLKESRCEHCGRSEWQGRPLSLQLHHKNGDGVDNRIENLEILCPNCHSQTETWGGRNGHRRKHLEVAVKIENVEQAAEG